MNRNVFCKITENLLNCNDFNQTTVVLMRIMVFPWWNVQEKKRKGKAWKYPL